MPIDFTSTNHGTLVTLTAVSPVALAWCDENLCGEELDPHIATIDIDSRYFFDIAVGILSDGLGLMDTATGNMAALPHA